MVCRFGIVRCNINSESTNRLFRVIILLFVVDAVGTFQTKERYILSATCGTLNRIEPMHGYIDIPNERILTISPVK